VKNCSQCGQLKPADLEHFARHGQKVDGLRPECKQCQSARQQEGYRRSRERRLAVAAEYRAANRELLAAKRLTYYHRNRESELARMRAAALKHEYGLSPEQYMDILDQQGGVCALCGRPPKSKSLSVDHDHETGQIRGLLCPPCNSALGRLGDAIDGLHRAVAYLETARERIDEALPGGPAYEPRSRRYTRETA